MKRVGVRELRQHASRYLARVESTGEPVEITDRGRPVARLVPIASDGWADMIASGEVSPADAAVDIRQFDPVATEFDGSRALAELRDEER